MTTNPDDEIEEYRRAVEEDPQDSARLGTTGLSTRREGTGERPIPSAAAAAAPGGSRGLSQGPDPRSRPTRSPGPTSGQAVEELAEDRSPIRSGGGSSRTTRSTPTAAPSSSIPNDVEAWTNYGFSLGLRVG